MNLTRAESREAFLHALHELYGSTGQSFYDEGVSQEAHALQSAALARQAGATDALVAACLLHDLGHLILDEHRERGDFLETDRHHEKIAHKLLGAWFGPAVTDPIRLHVDAKRVLCAEDRSYHDGLSEASQNSLRVQGGPGDAAFCAAFRTEPHAEDALQLRRWDDLAKTPGVPTASFASYLGTLGELIETRPA